MAYAPQIPGLDNKGAGAGSSTAEGTLVTTAQSLSAAQQAQARTNLALASMQVIDIPALATITTDTAYVDSPLALTLAIGTHFIDFHAAITSSDVTATHGAQAKVNFTGVFNPSNPYGMFAVKLANLNTAGWVAGFPGVIDALHAKQFTNHNGGSTTYSLIISGRYKVEVSTAGVFSIQGKNIINLDTCSIQPGSFLAATCYG